MVITTISIRVHSIDPDLGVEISFEKSGVTRIKWC